MIPANRLHSVQEYYFSQKLREVAQRIASGQDIINMGIGSPDLAPPEGVVTALQEGFNHPKAHQYQSYQGLPELREAMAAFYQKYFDVTLNPQNQVLPLMGSKEGIMHISLAFLNPGDQVLLPNPGYPTYASVTKLVEAEALYYPLTPDTHWQPDFNFLEKLDTSKIKLMWLNYPHMPTGAQAKAGLFEKLVQWAKKNEVLLVNDNPYSFVLNENPKSILSTEGALETAIELNSLSKTFNMAGWRVGMVLGHERFIQAILKVKSNMDSGMFYGIQKGAIAALNTSDNWYKALHSQYIKRKQLLLQLTEKLGLTVAPNQVGLFLWAKLPTTAATAEEYVNALLDEKNIFIAPGTIFGTQGEGYVRFSLCVDEPTIEKAIARL
jgi:LL-diaminopimelate aminotransferase